MPCAPTHAFVLDHVQVSTTHTFYVFHRTGTGIRNYSNAHFMISKAHARYQRSDWLKYHTSSKAWPGRFAQIPAVERVKQPTKKKKKKKTEGEEEELEVEDDDDEAKGAEEEKSAQETEESIIAGAEEDEKARGKLFRREQIPSRYLIDMLLRYGRAWDTMPSFQGAAAKRVVVIDPFCGSCSTARAAWATDCSFIGVDIDPVAKTLFQGDADAAPRTSTWAKMVAKNDTHPKVLYRSLCLYHAGFTLHVFTHVGSRSSAVLLRHRQRIAHLRSYP